MLLWISTKTFNFSNHCAVVKTREQHNLPTLPLKTVKSKFINQRLTDCFWRFSADICQGCVTPAYIIVCLLCSIAAGWCESQAIVSNFIWIHSKPSSCFANICGGIWTKVILIKPKRPITRRHCSAFRSTEQRCSSQQITITLNTS